MKKYLYVCMAIVAVACGRDEMQDPQGKEKGENGDGLKTYTVSLDLKGESVEIDQEPLGRAAEGTNDLYWLQIDQTPEAGGSSSHYAYGIFDRKENMTVKLMEGYTYSIGASLIKDGRDKIWMDTDTTYHYPVRPWNDNIRPKITNSFVVTPNNSVDPANLQTSLPNGKGSYDSYSFPEINRFYGKVNGYVPVENGKIAINMYRMMFGYRIEMEPFDEGMAIVEFLDYKDTIRAASSVTKKEREILYSYDWGTIDTYGQDTTVAAQEEINNMSRSSNYDAPDLRVKWISADGSREVIAYNDRVGVQRLKRAIFKITLKKGVAQNGAMDMKMENVKVIDGESLGVEGNIGSGVDTDIDTGK